MQAHFATISKSGTNFYDNAAALKGLQKLRKGLDDVMTGSGQFFARQMQVNSATETFTKRLAEQKVTFAEAIKSREMFNKVLREQISLQNASAIQWTRNSNGKINATLYQPEQLAKASRTARMELGLLNQYIASGSDQLVKWGKNTQWAGRQLMVGFTVPIAIAAAATGKFAYDMDKALTQITKVYGDVTQGIQENSQSIRDQAMATASAVTRMYGQSAADTLAIQSQLAASGKTGNELQQATVATSRAAVLGELEWQDAVKATISLQEVYHHNAQQIGEDFNYINAMENQTVLTSQDFVTAIPKVAGVMNALGADLKQTGTLLTAFKAAGIDAAEGANALKSINFRLVATYGKGLKTFNEMTGRDLKEIINQTNGETIPSLEKFAEAIKDLSAPQKIAVTRDVFGIYQGSKALLLLQQMTEKTDQWNQAINVANNSLEQNAAIANQELERLNERPFMRIKKAVEGLKIALAEAGEQFLQLAAPMLEMVERIISGFNELSPAVKTLLLVGAGMVAIIGPIVMLGGLLGNLVGNFIKFGSVMAGLLLRFKITNAEQRTQELLSRQAARGWDAQTAAVSALTLQLERLAKAQNLINPVKQARTAAIAETRYATNPMMMQANYGAAAGVKAGTDKTGRQFYYDASNGKRIKELEYTQRLMGAVQAEALAMNRAFDTARIQNFVSKVAGASAGLGALTLMFGDTSNSTVKWTSSLLIGAGILGSIFPAAITKAIEAVKALALAAKLSAAATLANSASFQAIRSAVTSIIPSMSSMMPLLKGIGIGFGVLAVAGVVAWKQVNDAMEASRKKMEDYGKSAEALAETIGYAYQKTTSFNFTSTPSGQQSRAELSAKFQETDAGKALVDVTKAKFTGNTANDVATIWDEAIAAALKAKMHGATEEQAKLTARVILGSFAQTMNMKDSEFEVNFHNLLDFSSAESMVTASARELRRQFNSAWADEGSGSENWFRTWISGQGDLSAGGLQQIKDAAAQNWQIMAGADPKDREKIFNEQFATINQELMTRYMNLQKTQGQWMKDNGINSFNDFLNDNWDTNTDIAQRMGITDEQFAALSRQREGVKAYIDEWTRVGGITKQNTNDYRAYLPVLKQINGFIVDGPSEAEVMMQRENAMSDYIRKVQQMGPAYDKLGAAEKLSLLNSYRLKAGLEETGNVMDWFATQPTSAAVQGLADLDSAMKAAGISAEITGDQAKESWKNVMTGTIDMVTEGRQQQLEDMWQSHIDSVQKKGQDAVDAIDKNTDKMKERFDDKWDAISEREKKRQDAAKNAVEKSYDARVKAVDKAIDREQKAEDIRKKIFEAEENRIKRLAELFNDAIDINVAINTGKLDEAAKLQNDVAAKQAQWSLDDTSASAGDASAKKVESLQDKKQRLQDAKAAELDNLKTIQDAQNKALEDRKKREQRALDDRIARMKDNAKRQADIDNKNAKSYVESRKKSFDQELALIRSYTPKNQAEMNAQIKAIDSLYVDYGGKLKTRGEGWAKSVSSMLTYQTKLEAGKLSTIVNWAQVGSEIATAMIQGAFGMTPQQFGKWLNGGDPPASSPMAGENYNKKKYTQMMDRLERNSPSAKYHTGGVAGAGGGRPTGRARSNEIDSRLLLGEGIVNLKGMQSLGKQGLNAINSGQLDSIGGMGGGGMLGLGSLPGAMLAPMAVGITRQAIAGAAARRMNVVPKNQFGSKVNTGQTTSDVVGNAVSNLLGSVSGMVGTTGKVLYLGHNGMYDGRANLGRTVRPTTGLATSPFGPRNLLGMSFHNGLDIANRAGTPTRAVAAGKVLFSGWDKTGYGNYVEIAHPDGTVTGYGHHRRLLVRAGDRVSPGTQIGEMGTTGASTGNHLHFQTGRNGNWFNPRLLFPGLQNGGYTLNDGYAMLHEKEAVLTKPLTAQLNEGVQRFSEGPSNVYNVNVTVEGDGDEAKIARVVKSTIRDIEKNSGPNRKIGN